MVPQMEQINEHFIARIKGLADQLGLPPPDEMEDPVSLTIDGRWTAFIGTFGEEDIAMFVAMDAVTDKDRMAYLLRQNLFSKEYDQPRVALTDEDLLLLWIQLPLMGLEDQRIYGALMTLSERVREYQEWLDDPNAVSRGLQDSEVGGLMDEDSDVPFGGFAPIKTS